MAEKNQEFPLYYDSDRRGFPLVDEIKELIRYRDLLILLISSSIKTRYKRSALGVVWTLLNPLLYMSVMTIAFSHIFRFQVANYPVYLLSGLIAWNFFTQSTTQAMHTLVWGATLLKRIYLPRTIFAVAAIGNGIINLLLACIPLLIIMLLTHQPIYSVWLFLPVPVLILSIVSLGVSLIMSTIAVFFADIIDMYQVLLQAAFYLTPIMYPDTILPPRLQPYLLLNPIYDVVKVFREPIYAGHFPALKTMMVALAAALVLLFVGWWLFIKKSDEIAYRL